MSQSSLALRQLGAEAAKIGEENLNPKEEEFYALHAVQMLQGQFSTSQDSGEVKKFEENLSLLVYDLCHVIVNGRKTFSSMILSIYVNCKRMKHTRLSLPWRSQYH